MSEKLDKFRKDYFSEEILDIYHLFSNEQLEIIKKLGIKIEDKKYSIYDFDVMEMEIMKYYKNKESLKNKHITIEEYMSILSIFDNISAVNSL